jgi:dihydroorotate dehydrogenase
MDAGAPSWLARAALPLLLRLPPETAHSLGLHGIKLLAPRWSAVAAPARLRIHTLGLRFAHPLGLAAGFDKNGDYLDALGALGFSHIEIGTVTPRPQPGNQRPRLFRLRGAQALINRMGFNNRGADYVASRVAASTYRGVRGISIGKNATTPLERAADDYLLCLRTLYPVADYFAINVSSPNTQGLRTLQRGDTLAGLVEPLQEERERLTARHGKRVPLLIKISPDLDDAELQSMAASLRNQALDGVIATNTSTHIAGFEAELARAQCDTRGGGLSGEPLREKSLASLRALRAALGPDFPIISVGGLMSAADVCARRDAGADLLQLYTGFVYRGPALLTRSLQALSQ